MEHLLLEIQILCLAYWCWLLYKHINQNKDESQE